MAALSLSHTHPSGLLSIPVPANYDDELDSPVIPAEVSWLATPHHAYAHPSNGTGVNVLSSSVGQLKLSDLPDELGREDMDEADAAAVGLGLGIGVAAGQRGRRNGEANGSGQPMTRANGTTDANSSAGASYSPISLPAPSSSASTGFPSYSPSTSTSDSPTLEPKRRSLTLEQRLSNLDTRPPVLALGLNTTRAEGGGGLRPRDNTADGSTSRSGAPTNSARRGEPSSPVASSRPLFPTTSEDPFSFRESTSLPKLNDIRRRTTPPPSNSRTTVHSSPTSSARSLAPPSPSLSSRSGSSVSINSYMPMPPTTTTKTSKEDKRKSVLGVLGFGGIGRKKSSGSKKEHERASSTTSSTNPAPVDGEDLFRWAGASPDTNRSSSPSSVFRRLAEGTPPTSSAPAFRRFEEPAVTSDSDPPSPASVFRRMMEEGSPEISQAPTRMAAFRRVGDSGEAVASPAPSTLAPSPASIFRRMGWDTSPDLKSTAEESVVTSAPAADATAQPFRRTTQPEATAIPLAASPMVNGLRRTTTNDSSSFAAPPSPSPSRTTKAPDDLASGASSLRSAKAPPSPGPKSLRRLGGDDGSPRVASSPAGVSFRRFGAESTTSPALSSSAPILAPAPALSPMMVASPIIIPSPVVAAPDPVTPTMELVTVTMPEPEPEEPAAAEPDSPATAFRRLMEESSPELPSGSTGVFRKFGDGDDAAPIDPPTREPSPASVFRRLVEESSPDLVASSSPAPGAFKRVGDSPALDSTGSPAAAFRKFGQATASPVVLATDSPVSSFRKVAGSFTQSSPAMSAADHATSVFERMAAEEEDEHDEIDHDDPFWSAMQAPPREARAVGMFARVQQDPFEAEQAQAKPIGRPASRSISSIGSGVSQSRSMASGAVRPLSSSAASAARSVKSVKSVPEVRDVYAGLPPYPAPRSDLFLKQLTGEDLHKHEASHSAFKRSKPTWQARYLILTSYPTPVHSAAPILANLHAFKSSFATDKEMARLELTKDSIICMPDDSFGRMYALKVTGIVAIERDVRGRLPPGYHPKEDSWLIGMDGVDSLKLWMEQLRAIVEELGTARVEDAPATEMTRTASTSTSIRSLETRTTDQTRVPASPHGSMGENSPSRPVKSARRPMGPESTNSSSRLSHYSSKEFGRDTYGGEDGSTTPSTTFSSNVDEDEDEDDDEDDAHYHPYRRGSVQPEEPKRLSVPPNARRLTADDSPHPYRPQLSQDYRRDSDLSSHGSISHLPRATPSTPPREDLIFSSFPSPGSRSPSMRTVASHSERNSSYSKRMSVQSTGSNGSGSSPAPAQRAAPPIRPAPTGHLPPPPKPPPMSALPLPPPMGALPPPPPHGHHPFAAPPPMRPPPMSALPPPPMNLPLPPPPVDAPLGLRTYGQRTP